MAYAKATYTISDCFRTAGTAPTRARSSIIRIPVAVAVGVPSHRRFLSSAAVKLSHTRYLSADNADGPLPLIIIHGLFGNKRNWSSLAKAFCRKLSTPVFTIDVRNHGNSTHTAAMDFHSMAADVEQWCSELGVEKTVVLGHSMGGKIAMTLALTKPLLVSQLVVVDVAPTTSRLVRDTMFPCYIDAMCNCYFDQSLPSLTDVRRHVMQQLQKTIEDYDVLSFLLTNVTVDESGTYGWLMNLDAIRDSLDKLVAFPHFEEGFAGRTLFIGGSKSAHISREHYADIRRLFPLSEIQHVAGAGHWVHADRPHEFIAAVTQFIAEGSR